MGRQAGGEELDKVLAREFDEIKERREVAGFNGSDDRSGQSHAPANLVGLALSGGGLRSAIFNLGLLQALSHRGLLKYVDYLSSVSGGGYIAGHLAVKATQHTDGTNFHDSEESYLGVCPRSGKHLADYRFKHAGGYLEDVIGWLGGWFGGTLVTLFLFMSAFGALATLAALYWRSVDITWFRERSSILGIGQTASELEWAFLPAIPFLCVWVVVLLARWAERWRGRGSGQWFLNSCGFLFLWLALVPALRLAGADGLLPPVLALLLAAIPIGIPVDAPGQRGRVLVGAAAATFLVLVIAGLGLLFVPEELNGGSGFLGRDRELFRGVTTVALVFTVFSGPLTIVRCYVTRHKTDPDPYRYPARWMTVAAITSIVISIAVFLGNSIAQVSDDASSLSQQWSFNSMAVWFAFAAGLVQFLTLLGMDRLFRSQAAEASNWQRIQFNTVVTLLIVMPLFALIHWMARENISGFADHRDPDLLVSDFREWESIPGIISDIPELKENIHPSLIGEVRESTDNLIKAEEAITGQTEWEQHESRLTSGTGLLSRGAGVYLGISFKDDLQSDNNRRDPYQVYFIAERTARESREKLVKRINELLDRPALTKNLLLILANQLESRDDAGIGDKNVYPAKLTEEQYAKLNRWFDNVTGTNSSRPHLTHEARTLQRLWDRYAQYAGFYLREAEVGPHAVVPIPLDSEDLQRLNRLLLEAIYQPDPYWMLVPRKLESTSTVAGMDQRHRARWLLGWLAAFGVMLFVTSDLNRISPTFRFYRDALERHFLRPDYHSEVHPLLTEVQTCGRGAPYHLFSGCLMLRRSGTGSKDTGGRHDYERSEVERYPFLFSRHFCGVRYGRDNASFRSSDDYVGGGLQLADAVTVSGSALSPYMTDNPWLTWFMSAFNIRLGMWLNNPSQTPAEKREDTGRRPQLRIDATPARLFKEWYNGFWRTDSTQWDLGFVADGGFRENLGVEALLVRQCALIIASDAGNNGGEDQFSSLASLVRLARSEYGIEFYDLDHDRPIDLDRFQRDSERHVSQQILCLRIRYPDKPTFEADGTIRWSTPGQERPWYGMMIYLQMSMTGLEDVDLQQIRKRLPKFPDEPTTNQFYTKEQVEAYRMLGYHIGNVACNDLPDRRKPLVFEELLTRLKMSYLWECRREHACRTEDISVEALFDFDTARLTLANDESEFQMAGQRVEDWLDRYTRDADFRLFQRRRVYRLLNGDDDQYSGPGRAYASDWWEWKNSDEMVGRLLIIAVACHELVSGKPADPEKQKMAAGTRTSRLDLFRVGGRERFEQLARVFLEERESWPTLDKIRKMLAAMEARREIKATKVWMIPIERFLLKVRQTVFVDHQTATVAAFGCCLIRARHERETGLHPSTTRESAFCRDEILKLRRLLEAKLSAGVLHPLEEAFQELIRPESGEGAGTKSGSRT